VTGLIAPGGPQDAARLLIAAIAVACGAGAAFGILYTLLAAAMTVRFFRRAPAEPADFPPVTLVRPLHGGELALLRNLTGFCRQDYPGTVQHLFGVRDPADPALAAVEELRRLHPEAHITVVADPREHGPNRKVSNLINMLPQARHDVLVFADSDVGVAPDYLRRVVGELQGPGVGLVTCLYRGEPDPGFWPRLSAMATSCQFLPGAVAGVGLGMARPCFGQTIAMRRSTLEGIGGLAPFSHHLAEDHAIGEAVRAAGGKVAIPPFAVSHACVEDSLARLISHELRWSRTIRAVDPRGHLGSAVAHPFALSLLAVLLSGGAAWAWILAAAALASRLTLKVAVDRALRLPVRGLWLLPAWDLLALPIFAATYLSARVKWRGHDYTVDGRGLLTQVADE
jgi:ceramide glucosyltransferase